MFRFGGQTNLTLLLLNKRPRKTWGLFFGNFSDPYKTKLADILMLPKLKNLFADHTGICQNL